MLMTKEILGKDIYELNRKHYDMLKKEVTDENVTWILGAGISAPAGLPNWTTLLAKMWARLSELENEMPLNHEVEEGERIIPERKTQGAAGDKRLSSISFNSRKSTARKV